MLAECAGRAYAAEQLLASAWLRADVPPPLNSRTRMAVRACVPGAALHIHARVHSRQGGAQQAALVVGLSRATLLWKSSCLCCTPVQPSR